MAAAKKKADDGPVMIDVFITGVGTLPNKGLVKSGRETIEVSRFSPTWMKPCTVHDTKAVNAYQRKLREEGKKAPKVSGDDVSEAMDGFTARLNGLAEEFAAFKSKVEEEIEHIYTEIKANEEEQDKAKADEEEPAEQSS